MFPELVNRNIFQIIIIFIFKLITQSQTQIFIIHFAFRTPISAIEYLFQLEYLQDLARLMIPLSRYCDFLSLRRLKASVQVLFARVIRGVLWSVASIRINNNKGNQTATRSYYNGFWSASDLWSLRKKRKFFFSKQTWSSLLQIQTVLKLELKAWRGERISYVCNQCWCERGSRKICALLTGKYFPIQFFNKFPAFKT